VSSANLRQEGRFRQPLGGISFLPHPLLLKRYAISVFEVPPKVGGHPPGRFWRGQLERRQYSPTTLPSASGFAIGVVGNSERVKRLAHAASTAPVLSTIGYLFFRRNCSLIAVICRSNSSFVPIMVKLTFGCNLLKTSAAASHTRIRVEFSLLAASGWL